MVDREAEIADLEGRVANAAADLANAVAEVTRLVVQWDQVAAALETDRAARAKRMAHERVIERIESSFESTGIKRPAYVRKTFKVVPITRAAGPDSRAREISGGCSATRWT